MVLRRYGRCGGTDRLCGLRPSYCLKGVYGTPPLSPLRHLHGAVFTLWMVLFAVQTSLIAARRTTVHRRLGMAGVVLAATMVVVGTAVAIAAAKSRAPWRRGSRRRWCSW